ncbi:hypothetical protein CKO11_04230 [Rhodobacter sp. TJ_12]|uniref:hypothetical protein n=1 Tax=Rhodobacter sp. TJ_12 TaxID=2029399 RepID=UPI001CC118CA|nr:hypothetical protein [Rhodobacter sp. TJ_12]MBZ4021667.1 hypothetical protein [Rhodobacter sp. TJ_12]
MSSPADPAPAAEEKKPRARITLDDLTKFLGVIALVLGGGKYFYDKAEAAAHEAQSRSIAYIEAWGAEPLLGARETLYDFWAGQPDLISVFGTEALSRRQYAMMLQASLFRTNADAPIRAPLLVLDNFYSQMSFCARAGLCDRAILDAYFCHVTRKNVVAYTPFYDRIRAATGDRGIGRDMQGFAQDCPPESPPPQG